jgi:hypothetical protein
LGNFVYIDTDNESYPEQIKEAINSSVFNALKDSGKPKISFDNLKLKNICEVEEAEEMTRYYTHFILKEEELLTGVDVSLHLS